MRKIIASLLAVAFLSAPLLAESIELDLKVVKLVLPLQEVNTAYLYDIKYEKSLIGLETPVFKSKNDRIRGTVGSALEEGENSVPWFVSLDAQVSEKYFQERFNVGAWGSYDFEKEDIRGGIKATMRIW